MFYILRDLTSNIIQNLTCNNIKKKVKNDLKITHISIYLRRY